MLPSDLRDYCAPSWWRSNAHLVWAGVFAALVAWDAVNQITGARSAAVEQPLYKGQVAGSNPAAPTLDCLRVQRGQWLYGAIRHAGDIEPLRAECFYGYGGAKFIQ